MNEQEIVEKFRLMCEQSINPDLYSTLVDRIIPALTVSRKALANAKRDAEEVKDGKLQAKTVVEAHYSDKCDLLEKKLIRLTSLEKCIVEHLDIIKETALSYDKVYVEHEVPGGCITSDGLFIVLSEIRKHIELPDEALNPTPKSPGQS